MTAQNKNILIGGLLAIVLVMAVGYAAFATNLNITGTANISSSWDVHFNSDAQVAGDVAATKTFTGGSLPTGTITYGSGDAPLTATVTANLNQPGDQVVFTLRIINAGTLPATAGTPTITGAGQDAANWSVNGLVATKGNIKFTVTSPTPNAPLAANNGTATMTVTAQFVDTITGTCSNSTYTTQATCEANEGTWTEANFGQGTTGNTATQTGTITVGLNYTQYTS